MFFQPNKAYRLLMVGFKVRGRQKARLRSWALTIKWLGVTFVGAVATLALTFTLAQAQGRDTSKASPSKPQTQKPLDPMNLPMDELGVTGKDDTLCSDRWDTYRPTTTSSSIRNIPAGR
jgi:hypothetical protein